MSPPSASGGGTEDQSSVGQHLVRVGVSSEVPQLTASSETLGRLEHGAFLSLKKKCRGIDDRDGEYRNFHPAWIMCFQSNLGKRLWSLRDRTLLPPADWSIQVVFTITVI